MSDVQKRSAQDLLDSLQEWWWDQENRTTVAYAAGLFLATALAVLAAMLLLLGAAMLAYTVATSGVGWMAPYALVAAVAFAAGLAVGRR